MSLTVNKITNYEITKPKNLLDELKAQWNPEIKAAEADSSIPSISIYEPIGLQWDGTGATAKKIAGALRAIGAKDIEVNINSYGGDVFDGIAIYNLLASHPAKVTVNVVGIAASAASIIAMAGDEVLLGDGAIIMVHNAWTVAFGNKADLQQVVDQLTPVDNSLIEIYAAKTGLEADKIKAMMNNETFITAQDAIDLGFADGMMSRGVTTANASKDNKLINGIKSLTGATNSQARELKAFIKKEFGIDGDTDKDGIDCDANELMIMAQAFKNNLMKGV